MAQKTESKAVKVWNPDFKYIKDVQADLKLRNPQEAIRRICSDHAEIHMTPIQRAQHAIAEAQGMLPEGNGGRLLLARVNQILGKGETGQGIELAKKTLGEIIASLDHADQLEHAKKTE